MKQYYGIQMICLCLMLFMSILTEAQMVYYTGNGGDWNNWDLYSYDIGPAVRTRLTTNPAIDNHPDISHVDPSRIVFSSNRGNGEFDIYVANTVNVDATAVRLTMDLFPGSPGQGKYPDRHPHWHPNGELIVFTAKNRGVFGPFALKTECSQPLIIIDWRYFEGMTVIRIDAAGNVLNYTPLDVRTAWDQVNYPGIWVPTEETYVGHPSFNNEGNQMVFTGSIDGEGKNWEVYTCGFDPVSRTLIPNSLRRRTFGPNNGNNPIKMSGGAKFSNDDSQIIFNSTRITSGNSQIYAIPATAIDWPVTMATQLTFHPGNDYIPEPLPGSDAIVITSDLGPVPLCGCELGFGPTADLDVVLLQGGNRTILGNDADMETALISDEVSWFCGSKPNLSSCTDIPRIMSVETAWLEHNPTLLPPDILAGYGPNYFNMGQQFYYMAWNNLYSKMMIVAPTQLFMLQQDMEMLGATFPPTGWSDLNAVREWYYSTTEIRTKKYVVPAVMYSMGLAGSPFQITPYNNYLPNIIVPDYCDVCHDALQNIVTGGMTGSFFDMQPQSNTDLVAGIKINLLPGTTLHVATDKKFHAWIDPANPHCPGSLPPGAPPEGKAQIQAVSKTMASPEKLTFRVYPNPATQSFWVELPGESTPGEARIEVFNISGTKIFGQDVRIEKRVQLSLPGESSGIYFVRLVKGGLSGDQILILN